MAKKPTEKQLYKLKNEWLGQFFEEVKPKEFYRAVFPEGSFERAGHFEDGKANGIITIVENDKAKNRIVFDDLSVIEYCMPFVFQTTVRTLLVLLLPWIRSCQI